ncbi:MAG: HRDC domain-containing protein [Bacteroides sp.]|nr:HRDC domain-containing protein [Bacteroides sp.]MCM1084813.1 HRDC domain-containing protein [Bacteroides sp.]
MKVDVNPEFAFAMELVEETDQNLFLTGRAGTGKTTFLKELVRRSAKRMVVLAPTGIAAINAGGSTLHSFFQLPFGLYLPGYSRKNKFRIGKEKINLMRSIDLMVIDEVSMLRADILDEVSGILKRYRNDHRPFGGVQLLMIGDLQQLAPIVKDDEWEQMKDYYASPYFFESEALKSVGFSCVELQKIYRQNDAAFIGLLEKIRTRNIDPSVLELLHSRYVPGFVPPEEDGYITLTTHNYQSDRINEASLAALPEKESVYEAQISGTFPESSYPTAFALRFKPGAQVMFVKNDSSPDHRYYNGKIGFVTRCGENAVWVRCNEENREPEEIKVEAESWENTKYVIDNETKEIKADVEGSFKQIPLRLAWAVTIHKSQGLTFHKVVIDAGRAFAHGQVYVALSRCRTLEGIVLRSPLTPESIVGDDRIDSFVQNNDFGSNAGFLVQCKADYRFDLIRHQFNFSALRQCLREISDVAHRVLPEVYPRLYGDIVQAVADFEQDVFSVGERFFVEINRLPTREKAYQDERCTKAAAYFLQKLENILQPLIPRLSVEIDNQKEQERLADKKAELKRLFTEKQNTLKLLCETKAFDITAYLRAKSEQFFEKEKDTSPVRKAKTTKKENISATPKTKPGADPDETRELPVGEDYARLFEALRAWRTAKYKEEEKPAFMILSQKALISIAQAAPRTKAELLGLKGIGKVKAAQYGDEILEVVRDTLG